MATSSSKRSARDTSSFKSKRGSTDVAAGNADLTFKSPAEFFAENKNIAGFDNPGKSLYTTVRELVENGLDAAEAVPTSPIIHVSIECIGDEEFCSIVGMTGNQNRIDSALYKDVETDRERRKREIRERRDAKRRKLSNSAENIGAVNMLLNAGHLSDSVDTDTGRYFSPQTPELSQGQSQSQSQGQSVNIAKERPRTNASEIFRVTVRDNGTGMAHVDVPDMMGRVLAGTKYCLKQSRGKFGLGSKMALIWSKMSTGLPIQVRTSQSGSPITTCTLDIDMAKNIPTVISHGTSSNNDNWRGTEVSVTIQGSWTSYRAKLLLYMRQMAVITPYAEFRLSFRADASREDKNFEILFARRTDVMPPPAKEVKHHPSSVDQYRLKQLVEGVPSSTTLREFLTGQFVSISPQLASRLVTELGSDFDNNLAVGKLETNHIRQLHALLHMARFDKPDGSSLSPAGEYNLRLGITKELQPSMIATHAEPADVFEGHAFIIEAGVALGGNALKPGINVFRFANRIPLLFEAGNDVVTKTARDCIRWNSYKISPVSDRIGVICSIVSTKIPFKGTGKEYIGDDADTIKAAVKRAITQCCIQLKAKLVRKAALKDAAERRKSIARYAPDVANAIANVFENMPEPSAEVADIAAKFSSREITRDSLKNFLVEHVDRFDKEQALEMAATTGRDEKALETVLFARRSSRESYLSVGPVSASDDALQLLLLRPLSVPI